MIGCKSQKTHCVGQPNLFYGVDDAVGAAQTWRHFRETHCSYSPQIVSIRLKRSTEEVDLIYPDTTISPEELDM